MSRFFLGEDRAFDLLDDDCRYVLDLGILRADQRRLEPANPIYREVIVRTLNYSDQFVLRDKIDNPWMADGRLDLCVQMGAHRYPVEIKLRYSDKAEADGLDQLAEYMDACGAKEAGWRSSTAARSGVGTNGSSGGPSPAAPTRSTPSARDHQP